MFLSLILDNFTEELLALHEHQVEVMKNYCDENKEIFKLVERRETLFKTMEEFEVITFYVLLIIQLCKSFKNNSQT